MNKKRVLVTGATGFIGRQFLQPLLDRGYEVHAVARHPANTPSGAIWHSADLLDRDARVRLLDDAHPDALLHCAWYTEHGKFWHAQDNLQWRDASCDFFAQAAMRGVTRILGVGSCAEYDWATASSWPLIENTPCRPHTLYGEAKLATAQSLLALPISAAWARLFLLFGSGEHPDRLVPSIIRPLLAGQPALCGSGKQIRDFMSSRDAGYALAALLDSSVTGFVNVASGQRRSIGDLVQSLGQMMGHPELIRMSSRPDRLDDPAFLLADVTRLRNETDFQLPKPLTESLSEAIDYWRNIN